MTHIAARTALPVLAAAAALVAGGAILAQDAAGTDSGPLTVGFVASSGMVPASGPTMIVLPVATATGPTAVIDAIGVGGGGRGGYRPPRLIRVRAVPDQACGGIWYPVTGAGGFGGRCAPDGTEPALGRPVPAHPATALSIGIEVGPPGKSGCWAISSVWVRYHVGHRHYTNVTIESLSGCTSE
ncbi:MAG: hypothetical protein ACRDNZ_14800 [Streptosporangiaceae bacterium]